MSDKPDKIDELRKTLDMWAQAMSSAIKRLRSQMKIRFAEQHKSILQMQEAAQQQTDALQQQTDALQQQTEAVQQMHEAVQKMQTAMVKMQEMSVKTQEASAKTQEALISTEGAMLRQTADFDQELARMEETFETRHSNMAVVFDAVFNKLDVVDELREQNKDILRRLEAVEKKIAS